MLDHHDGFALPLLREKSEVVAEIVAAASDKVDPGTSGAWGTARTRTRPAGASTRTASAKQPLRVHTSLPRELTSASSGAVLLPPARSSSCLTVIQQTRRRRPCTVASSTTSPPRGCTSCPTSGRERAVFLWNSVELTVSLKAQNRQRQPAGHLRRRQLARRGRHASPRWLTCNLGKLFKVNDAQPQARREPATRTRRRDGSPRSNPRWRRSSRDAASFCRGKQPSAA